jgi:transcriptional regulatory protein LevR
MGEILAAVEYIVSNCFTGEGVAIAFVYLLAAGEK